MTRELTMPAISADELLRKSHAVGQYYGFTPFSTLAQKARGKGPKTLQGLPESLSGMSLDQNAEVVANFLRQCKNAGLVPNARTPLFLWHTNVTAGRPAPKRAIVQFHAIGADRALADTIVIRALSALVHDLYRETPAVRINSMGDKETRARYARELTSFFKKRAATLPEACVTCAKRDVLEAAEVAIAEECADDLPAPTEHLSDAARKRFEDVLEYLEMTETPYELARDLVSRGNTWSDMCFELAVRGERVAWGSRYADLAKHFFGTSTPAVGAVLSVTVDNATVPKPAHPRTHIAFVHIGDEAKRVSLRLAEDFKRLRVPLAQDIGVESLTEQLRLADNRTPAYLLIMGRKEALEHTALLRNRQTQEETALPLEGLAERLKSLAS